MTRLTEQELRRRINQLEKKKQMDVEAPELLAVYRMALAHLLHAASGGIPDAEAMARTVIDEIAAERKRQVEQEGWTAEHDDAHDTGSLAVAAACYALIATSRNAGNSDYWSDRYIADAGALWPWDAKWWKPKNHRRDLVRAAALIVAEIERSDRAHSLGSGNASSSPSKPNNPSDAHDPEV